MKFSQIAFLLAVIGVGLALPEPAAAQSWTSTNLYNDWTSVAVTADGSKIAADSYLGGIYTSTDGGTNWLDVGSPDQTHWSVLAASTNGGNLVAAFYGGGIYLSPDWGTNWLPSSAASDNWNCLATSADGTRLVAGTSPGEIYTSPDSGATFTSRLPANNYYQAIAASADGSHLVTVVQGGKIYRSTDLGDTWAATTAPAANWYGIASSTNGLNLAAVVQNGGIYTSTDAGDSWTLTDAPTTNWSAVASSADGSQLVATVNGGSYYGGGPIYISTDAGADWMATSAPSNYWSAVYSSPDGVTLLALANGGGGPTGGSPWWSTNAGTTWSQLIINTLPLATNLICSDAFGLSIISSNLNSHVVATNFFTTNLVSLEAVIAGNPVVVTNYLGLRLHGTTNLTGAATAPVSGLLGISAPGKILFPLSPLETNLLGTGLLGIGWKAPTISRTNALVTRLAFPAGNSGILANTNLVQVLATNLPGLSLVISNVLTMQIMSGAVPQIWSALAASADGSQLVAAANGGWLYTSSNSGLTWTTNAGLIRTATNSAGPWTTNFVASPIQSWSALASSADGTKLVAAVANGGIFTAGNSGANWVSNAVPWQIADGEIALSSNSIFETQGMVWSSNNAPSGVWSALYSSPDGNTLVALARYGWSFKSTNGGAIWTELSTPYDFWQCVASSASGSHLLAASRQGYVYMSTNAGNSWSEMALALGGTNVVSTETISFSVIYTNRNTSGSDPNPFVTNAFGPFVSIPNLAISNNVAISPQGLWITNAIGFILAATNATGTNVIEATLGVDIQGSNVFALSPVSTDALGAGTLGPEKLLPYLSFTNVVATNLAVPDGTGPFNPGGVADTALTNIFSTKVAGLVLTITNVLNVDVIITNVLERWSAVAMSADGSHLAAAVNGGLIYVSTDFGDTWMATSAPSTNWSALVMSADGSQLTAAVKDGGIYSSSDAGGTWVAANVPAADWTALAASADDAELVAVVQGGVIYSLNTGGPATPVPALQIHLVPGNVVLAWPAAATNVVLQQKSNLMGPVWTDVPAAPIVTNGQNQVTLPESPSQALYRLRSQ